jgi:hypothetical protein
LWQTGKTRLVHIYVVIVKGGFFEDLVLGEIELETL